ncbi:hypothetical protein H0H81_007005, partial [Sphagnurus paluster]
MLARSVALEETLAGDIYQRLSIQTVCVGAPVKGLDWLRALLSEELYNQARQARPCGDENGATLEDAFEDAWFTFSHFAKAEDSSLISIKYLTACNVCGMAIQCPPNPYSIDGMFGIHFGIDKPIKEKNTGAGLWKARFREDGDINEHVINPTIAGSNKNPTLAFVFEMGSSDSKVVASRVDSPRAIGSGNDALGKHYQLVVHGVTSATFSVRRLKSQSSQVPAATRAVPTTLGGE